MGLTEQLLKCNWGNWPAHLRSLDLFSCIGCHALGFARAGIGTVAFCEIKPSRKKALARRFPGVPIYGDIQRFDGVPAEIVIGGPPCQRTSVAAAVHGKRDGESLWPHMLRISRNVDAKWIVVEQPPGNEAWEAEVYRDLSRLDYNVARFEFGACDVGAPYLRRRVFMVACPSRTRLEIARHALPSAIDRVKRAADARGDWDPDKLGTIRVDAGTSGGVDRRERIESLGDSNPPHMAEVIGHAIMAAETAAQSSARVVNT